MNLSGDVCDEVEFHSSMFYSLVFLSKLTSIKMYQSLRSVNASLGKQLVNVAVEPAELRLRETANKDVDLISRSLDEDDGVWFGVEEAQDRTMSAMGRNLLGIETEYKENELDEQKRTCYARDCQQSCRNGNKNSNSTDVVNEVFLRRVNVSAVSLLKTSYLQLESYCKRLDIQLCVKECARGVRDRVLQRASRICRYFMCSSLLGEIVGIKSLLDAYGVPYGFLDLDRDSHSFEKNINTTGKSLKLSKELGFALSVDQHCFLFSGRWMDDQTVLSDCRIDSGNELLLMKSELQPECADTAVRALADIDVLRFGDEDAGREESDCAAGQEPSVSDWESRVFQSEVTACWNCSRNIGLTRIQCKCGYHFCAEIAIIVKHLKNAKEVKGDKRIILSAERVERSENVESQGGKVCAA